MYDEFYYNIETTHKKVSSDFVGSVYFFIDQTGQILNLFKIFPFTHISYEPDFLIICEVKSNFSRVEEVNKKYS